MKWSIHCCYYYMKISCNGTDAGEGRIIHHPTIHALSSTLPRRARSPRPSLTGSRQLGGGESENVGAAVGAAPQSFDAFII